jgi:hypothetical protein
MKLHRVLMTSLAVACLVGVAILAQTTDTPGVKMATAAEKLLASLKDDQKAKGAFTFDDKERTNWNFIPLEDKATKKPTRKGLRMDEMTDEQKNIALDLLRAGTSSSGYTKATTIMSLESILADLEKNRKDAFTRSPGWYFVSVFGKPSKTGKWGWRIEGHHLSINFTLDGGKVIGSTPFFFGANPATVKGGKREGLRTLPEAEDHARELFKSLDEDQRKVAVQKEQFKEIEQGKSAPNVGEPKGLAGEKMTDKQRDVLLKLLKSYTDRMPGEVGEVELSQAKKAGLEKVHFAWAGDSEPGKPYTYRVQGPTFVIEFLNVQADSADNPANHIHSSWRNIKGDFGLAK